jgi:hypothetical protein
MMIRDDPYGKIHTDGSRSGGQLLDDSIEAKALALLDEVRREYPIATEYTARHIALCLAIEQHEAFKQEVSDAVVDYFGEHLVAEDGGEPLERFIIPKPKPDPLAEVLDKMLRRRFIEPAEEVITDEAAWLRAALEARGFEIREKGQ